MYWTHLLREEESTIITFSFLLLFSFVKRCETVNNSPGVTGRERNFSVEARSGGLLTLALTKARLRDMPRSSFRGGPKARTPSR